MKTIDNLINCVYIGLGANLNQPSQQLLTAIDALNNLAQSQITAQSSFYQSKPLGPQDQGDYINAVVKLQTSFSAIELLDQLQQIELNQGRVRKDQRWGPRTLDLDILLFNNDKIESSRLIVPHYAMKQRSFVLIPLAEITPDLILPDGSELNNLVELIDKQGIFKL